MNAGDEGVVTCTLPLQNLAVGEAADCTVSVLDQRDWGGCVDVQMVSAHAVLPPSPPPAPLVSNTGAYKMDANTVIDTSASTFTCCALEAELTVPDYQMGVAASFIATLSGKADGCAAPTPTPAHTHSLRPRYLTPPPPLPLPLLLEQPFAALNESASTMLVDYHPQVPHLRVDWGSRGAPSRVWQRHGHRHASALEPGDGRHQHCILI